MLGACSLPTAQSIYARKADSTLLTLQQTYSYGTPTTNNGNVYDALNRLYRF